MFFLLAVSEKTLRAADSDSPLDAIINNVVGPSHTPTAPAPVSETLPVKTGLGMDKAQAARPTSAAALGRMPASVTMVEQLGALREVNAGLIELCGDPAVAGDAFATVRLRAKNPAAVEAAYDVARKAAPDALSVRDYGRYRALLDGRAVDMQEVRAAVAASPRDPLLRTTLALAGLRSERPADAWSAFDDILVNFAEVPPGSQAVISAACAADGQNQRAAEMAMAIDTESLLPSEYALIAPLRAGAMSSGFEQITENSREKQP
jgi:hypothetical protein